MTVHNNIAEPWKVTLIDTGLKTMTGGRIKRIKKYTEGQPFLMTYGDGVSDINLDALIAHHNRSGKTATLTAVQLGGRFGTLEIGDGSLISSFAEKAQGRRRLDQRRVYGAGTGDFQLYRRGRDGL